MKLHELMGKLLKAPGGDNTEVYLYAGRNGKGGFDLDTEIEFLTVGGNKFSIALMPKSKNTAKKLGWRKEHDGPDTKGAEPTG